MTRDEYVTTVIYNNIEIKIGIDDYGQTYFIEYLENGNKKVECIGSYITDYMAYIEWRFGEPEKNCEYYDKVETTNTKSCEHINKYFCLHCRKFFNNEEWKKLQDRRKETAELLRKLKNENNIT